MTHKEDISFQMKNKEDTVSHSKCNFTQGIVELPHQSVQIW